MAKVETAERAEKGKKKKKGTAGAAAAAAGVKAKARKDKPAKPAKASKAGKSDSGKKSSRRSEGFEGLAKFVDHPLVADLLAAGAIAAVTAIAEHQLGDKKGHSSSKMVKSVGKAAAAAMGRKLIGDIGAITTAATDAARKA